MKHCCVIGRSNKDVLAAIAPLAQSEGLKVRVKTLPQRPFDVPANVLDCTRLLPRPAGNRPSPSKKALQKPGTGSITGKRPCKNF